MKLPEPDASNPALDPAQQREQRKILFQQRPTARAQELRRTLTNAERFLWTRLSRRQLGGHKFSRQMPVGPFICDFMCREARLVVEVDGGQHDDRSDQDASRTRRIEAEGYRVIRFWNNDVLGNMEGVLLTILRELQATPPLAPPASGRGTLRRPSPPASGTGAQ